MVVPHSPPRMRKIHSLLWHDARKVAEVCILHLGAEGIPDHP